MKKGHLQRFVRVTILMEKRDENIPYNLGGAGMQRTAVADDEQFRFSQHLDLEYTTAMRAT